MSSLNYDERPKLENHITFFNKIGDETRSQNLIIFYCKSKNPLKLPEKKQEHTDVAHTLFTESEADLPFTIMLEFL